MVLVALPDVAGGRGAANKWINPEHITQLVPHITQTVDEVGDLYLVDARIKLQGLPEFTHRLAEVRSLDDTDAKWQSFLRAVGGTLPADAPAAGL